MVINYLLPLFDNSQHWCTFWILWWDDQNLWILETKEYNLLTVVTFPMSIQIHPNNCKVLLDATAAAPYAQKLKSKSQRCITKHSSWSYWGTNCENNIILPITLLIKNSEWRIYIEYFSSGNPLVTLAKLKKSIVNPFIVQKRHRQRQKIDQ